jgi:hypothetical protein
LLREWHIKYKIEKVEKSRKVEKVEKNIKSTAFQEKRLQPFGLLTLAGIQPHLRRITLPAQILRRLDPSKLTREGFKPKQNHVKLANFTFYIQNFFSLRI